MLQLYRKIGDRQCLYLIYSAGGAILRKDSGTFVNFEGEKIWKLTNLQYP